jgi:hypothetical protein
VTFAGQPQTGQRTEANGGLCVFVLPERSALQLSEAVAGIARGIEILEVVALDEAQRSTAATHLGPQRQFPAAAGGPHTLVVACDVPPLTADGARRVAARIESVARHTTQRLLGADAPAGRASGAALHFDAGQSATDLLAALGDAELPARVARQVEELAARCAMPFPVARVLGAESPGYRARVALVDHPVHGRSVCKIFRPGAMAFFRRELNARTALADQSLVPRVLEHGPNWILTPEYTDDGRHRLRRLPGVDGMHQLRPWATRALAGLARTMHDRGLFVQDLSPQNLMSDPTAGLKVIDLEFVLPYAEFDVPPPSAAAAWSYRGVPAAVAAAAELPTLALTKGVGNSVFHPAVAGLPIERLLGPQRRGDRVRRVATQLRWYATTATAGRVQAALRRGR